MGYERIDRNRKYSGIGADTVAGTRGYIAHYAVFGTDDERREASEDLAWFRERYPENAENKFRAARGGAATEEAARNV